MKIKKYSTHWIIIAIYSLFLTAKMAGNVIPIDLYLISALAFVAVFIYFLAKVKDSRFVFNKSLILFWGFLGYNTISLAWTNAPNYGEQKLFILLSIVIISFLASEIIIRRTITFIKFIALGAGLILIWYLSVNGFKKVDLSSQYFRLDLKDKLNPIIIARYFCFSVITFIFLIRLYNNKRVFLLFIYGAIGLSLTLAFLTGSKGPMLALLLSLVIPYLLAKKFKFRITIKNLFLLLLGIFLFSYFIIPLISSDSSSALSEFIEQRYWGEDAAKSVSSRMMILDFSFNHIINQPVLNLLFGNGLGDFGYAFTGFDQQMYPHNILVEILYEAGVLGLFLFLLLIYKVIKLNIISGQNLLQNTFESRVKYYYITLFYFFLLCAMTTGDVAGNFFVFVSTLFIFQSKSIFSNSLIWQRQRTANTQKMVLNKMD